MKNKKRLIDLCVIAGLLVIALLLFPLLHGGAEQGAGVIVAVDGIEIARYSLEEDGTYELNGGTNTLVIEDGTARIAQANCPDELCVKQGKVDGSGQIITCLPNRLTVTVYGAEGTVELIS